MTNGILIKVCGLTSHADAVFADSIGADYFGFNLYPKSPRHVPLPRSMTISDRVPTGRKVAVTVEPEPGALAAARDAGFDLFQVHFRHDTQASVVEGWSREVGPERLWLAPKLPAGADVAPAWLALAGALLLDTFDVTLFGGTGRTSDWPKFRRHREAHPKSTWILSGGLSPENIGEALAASGARFVDVNSGVESAPGVKDHRKLEAFFEAVNRAPSR